MALEAEPLKKLTFCAASLNPINKNMGVSGPIRHNPRRGVVKSHLCFMVLVSDGSSEHVAHAYRKIGIFR